MFNMDEIFSQFVVLWAVIDPVGTVPVFIAVTKNYDKNEKKKIARFATIVSFIVLMFFLVIGEFLLGKVGVPIAAFQTSGGVILFLFALNMIFGSSKPEEEIKLIKNGNETAIFPLAMPSIAGPGAILAVVLMTDNSTKTFTAQAITALLVGVVLLINFLFMRTSTKVQEKIGNSGAIVISKVMGLILASMAANNILMGIKEYFKL